MSSPKSKDMSDIRKIGGSKDWYKSPDGGDSGVGGGHEWSGGSIPAENTYHDDVESREKEQKAMIHKLAKDNLEKGRESMDEWATDRLGFQKRDFRNLTPVQKSVALEVEVQDMKLQMMDGAPVGGEIL